jgi:hypothetical protein
MIHIHNNTAQGFQFLSKICVQWIENVTTKFIQSKCKKQPFATKQVQVEMSPYIKHEEVNQFWLFLIPKN